MAIRSYGNLEEDAIGGILERMLVALSQASRMRRVGAPPTPDLSPEAAVSFKRGPLPTGTQDSFYIISMSLGGGGPNPTVWDGDKGCLLLLC